MEVIDTCESNNGGCDHDCRQVTSGTVCFCHVGYQLLANGRSCAGQLINWPIGLFSMVFLSSTLILCWCLSAIETVASLFSRNSSLTDIKIWNLLLHRFASWNHFTRYDASINVAIFVFFYHKSWIKTWTSVTKTTADASTLAPTRMAPTSVSVRLGTGSMVTESTADGVIAQTDSRWF